MTAKIDPKKALQTDIAKLFGVCTRTVSRWAQDSENPCPRNDDGTFNATSVIAWRIELVERKASEAAGDPLLVGGGDSPNLERYRAAKAALTELELGERKKELIPRDELRVALGTVAAQVRRALTELQKRFGDDAAQIVGSALDSSMRLLRDANLAE